MYPFTVQHSYCLVTVQSREENSTKQEKHFDTPDTFGKEKHSIIMLCKILAFFVLPCLAISFQTDTKPAFKGNLSFQNAHNFYYISTVITE